MLDYLEIRGVSVTTVARESLYEAAGLTQYVLNANLTTISVEQRDAMKNIESLLRRVAKHQAEEPSSMPRRESIAEAERSNTELADRISEYISTATVKGSTRSRA